MDCNSLGFQMFRGRRNEKASNVCCLHIVFYRECLLFNIRNFPTRFSSLLVSRRLRKTGLKTLPRYKAKTPLGYDPYPFKPPQRVDRGCDRKTAVHLPSTGNTQVLRFSFVQRAVIDLPHLGFAPYIETFESLLIRDTKSESRIARALITLVYICSKSEYSILLKLRE
jgi:hypothetical protein